MRLDYFVTALSSSEPELYKFTERINVAVNTYSEKLQLTSLVNGKNVTLPNLPLWFNQNIDAKFNRPEQLSLSFQTNRK